MSKFNQVWNATYETIPADTEDESLGASRIRDLKVEVRERMQQDHSWNGDDSDGYHAAVTLLTQTADPTPTPASGTAGSIYSKVVSGSNELFYKDSTGNVIQLTTAGAINIQGVPSGSLFPYAGATAPAGYLLCFGQAISRTGNPSLFAVIGTTFGAGDGSTTFNVPDIRGRSVFGADNMGGTAAGRLGGSVAGGITGSAVPGATGGEQEHQLSQAEIPAHVHAYGSGSGGSTVPSTLANATGNGSFGFNTSSVGSNGFHNTTPPAIVINWIIKT